MIPADERNKELGHGLGPRTQFLKQFLLMFALGYIKVPLQFVAMIRCEAQQIFCRNSVTCLLHGLGALFVLQPFVMGHELKGLFMMATSLWPAGMTQSCLYFSVFSLWHRLRNMPSFVLLGLWCCKIIDAQNNSYSTPFLVQSTNYFWEF